MPRAAPTEGAGESAAMGDQPHDEGGRRKREQIAAGGPEEPRKPRPTAREHREPDDAESEIRHKGGGSGGGAEQATHGQDREVLERHRHRREGQRNPDLCREGHEEGAEPDGDGAPPHGGAGSDRQGLDVRLGTHIASTLSATALPPPRQRVASPVPTPRSFMA